MITCLDLAEYFLGDKVGKAQPSSSAFRAFKGMSDEFSVFLLECHSCDFERQVASSRSSRHNTVQDGYDDRSLNEDCHERM